MIKSAFFDTLRRSFWVHVNRQSSNILLEDKNRKKGMRSSQQNRSVLILNLINIPSDVDLSNKLPYHIINLNSFFLFFPCRPTPKRAVSTAKKRAEQQRRYLICRTGYHKQFTNNPEVIMLEVTSSAVENL
ncbi:MAG: hypothetical protein D3907_03155, partial [Candidatus Electrothrix sp. AUS3]|nr:hypothetical protein [Candidatus Electrothrix gigas]